MVVKSFKDRKLKRESFGIVPISVSSIHSLRSIYKKSRLTIPKIKRIWPEVVSNVFVGKSFIDKGDLQKLVPFKIIRDNYLFSDNEITDDITEIGLIVKVPDYLKLNFMSNLNTIIALLDSKLDSHEVIKEINVRIER